MRPSEGTRVLDGEGRVEGMRGSSIVDSRVVRSIGRRSWNWRRGLSLSSNVIVVSYQSLQRELRRAGKETD